MKDKAKTCCGIEDFEYGTRKSAVYENNDYLLQFGQAIENSTVLAADSAGFFSPGKSVCGFGL